jgi:hypothetical protein
MSTDGFVYRSIAPKRGVKPIETIEIGLGYEARPRCAKDAIISVDYTKFAEATRNKVNDMLESRIKLSATEQRYVCTDSACPNSKRSMALIDLVINPTATHVLQCPRNSCAGTAAEPVREFAGMTFERAIEHNKNINSTAGLLTRLIQEGDAYLAECGDTKAMTPAGAQLAGQPHPVTPLPVEPQSAKTGTPQRPVFGNPEFLESRRRPALPTQKQPPPKRARVRKLVSDADEIETGQASKRYNGSTVSIQEAVCAEQTWVVRGRVYRTDELCEDVVAQMDPDEAERYAAWYTTANDVLFDPDA